MWSMTVASVVVLPEPVAPVQRTRPRCSSARRWTPLGSRSSSKLGTFFGITRKANEIEPRWRYPLTRKRGSANDVYAMSSSPVSWKDWSFAGARSVTTDSAASRSASTRGTWFGSTPSSPSRRSTGGWPTLRWMSLAPCSTARARTAFRSTTEQIGRDQVWLELATERFHEAQRGSHQPSRLAGMPEVAAEEGRREAPDEGQPRNAVDDPREPFECQLRLPGRGQRSGQRRVELRAVAGQIVRQGALGGKARAHERFVDSVARERIDKAGCVADQQHAPLRGCVAGMPHRQPVSAQCLQLGALQTVLLARSLEMHPQPRPLRLPAADAHVEVVAFRKDPRIPAGNGSELDHGPPPPTPLARVNIRN